MSQDFKIKSKRNNLSARYQYIIFPFGAGELLDSLGATKMGYVFPPPPKMPRLPVGSLLDWPGPVAKKGNVVLSLDTVPQLLGVEGIEPEECISVFSEVLDIIKTIMVPDLDSHAIFYEVILNYKIDTGKNPLLTLGKVKPERNLYESIGEIFQDTITTFSLHFCSPKENLENTSWFDCKITPFIPKPDKFYDVLIVYRDKDKSKVVHFFSNIEENIRKIFAEIEK